MKRDSERFDRSELERRFAHYVNLFDGPNEFVDALDRPALECISAHRGRVTTAELEELFRDEGRGAKPCRWRSGAWTLPAGSRPGNWWEFRAGLIHVQEEASLLPTEMLGAKPGERVLDLCAAPGGKTAQIAMDLGNRGTVIANDRNGHRITALRDVIKRLGLLNVSATVHDGRELPAQIGTFDRVLVDAPCSSEGTQWRDGACYRLAPAKYRRWLSGVQLRLLERAIDRCRPGGRVVYSTCSFAPEENEAIVSRVLAERPGLRVVTFPTESLPPGASAGLTHFDGKRFSDGCVGAVRLWPHRTGTGGFFAMAFETPGDEPAIAGETPSLSAAPYGADWWFRFTERFGVELPEPVELSYFEKRRELRAVASDHRPPKNPPFLTGGVPLGKSQPDGARPSTSAVLSFGRHASRRCLELDREECEAYLRRAEFVIDAARWSGERKNGAAMVRHRGHGLGVAAVRFDDDKLLLRSEYPKAWVPGDE